MTQYLTLVVTALTRWDRRGDLDWDATSPQLSKARYH